MKSENVTSQCLRHSESHNGNVQFNDLMLHFTLIVCSLLYLPGSRDLCCRTRNTAVFCVTWSGNATQYTKNVSSIF